MDMNTVLAVLGVIVAAVIVIALSIWLGKSRKRDLDRAMGKVAPDNKKTRDIPPPRYPEDELASEPWYSVSPGDVFPEEFRHWLCADPRIGPLFEEMHADLFRADYWRALQNRIREGHVEDVYAYRRRQRFSVRYGEMLF